ncbi:MAG TPA: sugar phosphate nucleotidyltransferase [Salinivirgaceae bacterium]|nr:sugar phosphate nucleotidyltransferase [Salinivirgaceae bacterium]
MIAFIPAAGVGSRLGHITTNQPKAMVPVLGVPMIFRLIDNLKKQGFKHFVVNLHHHADLLQEFLSRNCTDVSVEFSNERQMLLDTGGAIVHAASLLSQTEHFLVHNVDVILPISVSNIYQSHIENQSLVTLAVSDRKSSRKLLFDKQNQLCGWINTTTGEIRKARNYTENHRALAFSGVHWTNRSFLSLETRQGKFSIIDSWLNLCHQYPIRAFEHTHEGWFDLGTTQNIADAEQYFKTKFHS